MLPQSEVLGLENDQSSPSRGGAGQLRLRHGLLQDLANHRTRQMVVTNGVVRQRAPTYRKRNHCEKRNLPSRRASCGGSRDWAGTQASSSSRRSTSFSGQSAAWPAAQDPARSHPPSRVPVSRWSSSSRRAGWFSPLPMRALPRRQRDTRIVPVRSLELRPSSTMPEIPMPSRP